MPFPGKTINPAGMMYALKSDIVPIDPSKGLVAGNVQLRPGKRPRPIALRIVWEIASAVTIPIIGIGGIATARDALEFLLAGASAIQVGTANFSDPCAAMKVVEGIEAHCKARQVRVTELIGSAR